MKVKPTGKLGRVVIEIAPSDEALFSPAPEPVVKPVSAFRMKKILVPLDFSECSLKALTYAIAFAKDLGASLDLLYVVPPYYALDPYGITEYERVEKEMRASGEQKLAGLVLNQVPNEVPATTLVRYGKAATEIIDVARERESDLIIISTHGHTGIKHVLVGGTTENVVRHAARPVLVVREKEREFIAN